MRAVICTKYGPPEVLKIVEVSKPSPKYNEVLVKVRATAVNSGDVRVRSLGVEGFMKIVMRLVLGFHKPRKPILGTVYSGIVESTGKKVSKFNIGDKVFGMTGFNFGTYAEYLVVKENSSIAFMPEKSTFEEAVSLIFGGQTAIYFLDKAKIAEKNKTKTLIIGATGSVGIAATQIAQYYGSDVTVVCSSAGKSLVENLGFSKIILYDKEVFSNQPNTYDIIFDAVGKTTKTECKAILAKGGIYKTVGGLEYASESQEQLEFIKKLYEIGKLKPIIDKTFSLEDVVAAHHYVDQGRKKGSVILKIREQQE